MKAWDPPKKKPKNPPSLEKAVMEAAAYLQHWNPYSASLVNKQYERAAEIIDAVVNSVKYKPCTTVRCYFFEDLVQLTVMANRHDAHCPERITTIGLQETISLEPTNTMGLEQVAEWARHLIHERLVRLEMHEVDEFLQFGKYHYRDPHPENRLMKLQMKPMEMQLAANALMKGMQETMTQSRTMLDEMREVRKNKGLKTPKKDPPLS